MCLFIDEKIHGSNHREMRPFVTQTDIVVNKLLKKDYSYRTDGEEYYAPYRDTEYVMGKLYKSKLVRDTNLVFEGLHAFYSHRSARSAKSHDFYGEEDISVFWAVIPKGSKVYLGEPSKEIVSNQLIVYKTKKDLEAVHGVIQPAIPKWVGLK